VAERQLFAPRPGFEAIERAALAAALRLVFVPARRLERPVSVWINFPLTFGDPSTEVDAEVALVRVEGSPLPARRLGPALGPAYRATRARPPLTWDGRGADVALAGLLDGSVTAAVTGRPATTEELTDARRRDVRLAELVIGHDGLAVVVHPDNPVRALTLAQLAALYRGEIARWPGVGGADRPVRLWATSLAAEDLGFFTERLGASGAPLRLASGASFVESPEQLLLAVAADRDAIGFASSALLARAAQPGASGRGGAAPERGASPAPSVRALRLAAADGELAFGPEALRTGRYPLRRPIFLYVRQAAPLAVTRLVDLLLSREGQRLVEAQGFTAAVDLPGRMGVALAAPGCPAPPPGTPPPAAAAPGALAAALPVAPSPSTPSLAAPRAAPRATPQAPSGAAMLTVRFGARDADLARTSRPTLERLARRLRRSDAAVLLVAPRDEDGRDGAARERAQRVAMFLRRRDVARERLQVRLGPPADDPRRVEVHVDPL
jgi:phosphate transport system substrate-binding protein